jgi:hypothetical protein
VPNCSRACAPSRRRPVPSRSRSRATRPNWLGSTSVSPSSRSPRRCRDASRATGRPMRRAGSCARAIRSAW